MVADGAHPSTKEKSSPGCARREKKPTELINKSSPHITATAKEDPSELPSKLRGTHFHPGISNQTERTREEQSYFQRHKG